LLWFFLGIFGVHRFYLERHVSGIIYLLTLGLFGIGWLVDICLIPSMVEHYNIHHDEHHHHHHHEYSTVVVGAPVGYQQGYSQPAYPQGYQTGYAAPPPGYYPA